MTSPTPVQDHANLWHAEVDGDPYFISAINGNKMRWRVTRQVDMSEVYRDHTVSIQRNGKVFCDCEGHKRGGKCRHVDLIKTLLRP